MIKTIALSALLVVMAGPLLVCIIALFAYTILAPWWFALNWLFP
jgi:hypothetical protein